MKKEILVKLQNKIGKDYETLISLYETKAETIADAYRIAHYNEVYDLLCSNDEETIAEWFDEEEIQTMIDCQANFIDRVWRNYVDYKDPEYFNFFLWGDLIDIVKDTIKIYS